MYVLVYCETPTFLWLQLQGHFRAPVSQPSSERSHWSDHQLVLDFITVTASVVGTSVLSVLVAVVIEERSGGGSSRRSSSALRGYTERCDRSFARAKPGLPYWRPCQQDTTPTMSSSSVPSSPRLPRPLRHPLSLSSRPSPLTPRPGSASVTSSSEPSSAAPADSSSGPCRRPRPSTRAEARNAGATADEPPWAEEEAGRSSAYGAIAWI